MSRTRILGPRLLQPPTQPSTTRGTSPSVKRIINTLSLLRQIKRSAPSNDVTEPLQVNDANHSNGAELVVLFAIVGLQINFPAIYERLAESPDFVTWTPEKLERRWELSGPDFNLKTGDDQFNELTQDWHKVLYLLCRQSSSSRKTNDIISVFDEILDALKEMQEQETTTSTPSLAFLEELLVSVSVTSVDSTASQSEKRGVRSDEITQICWLVHENLLQLPDIQLANCDRSRKYARQYRGYREYAIEIDDGGVFAEISLEFKRAKKERQRYAVFASVNVKIPHGKTKVVRERIKIGHLPSNIVAKEKGRDWLGAEVGMWESGKDVDAAAGIIIDKTKDFLKTVERWFQKVIAES